MSTPGRRAELLLWLGSAGCAVLFLRVAALALDGFDLPKELALAGSSLLALGVWLRQPRTSVRLDQVDRLLWASAALTAVSALGGVNLWVGLRGLLLSVGSVASFTVARALARGGRARQLLLVAVAALVLVACSMLLESQGVFHVSLANRAPGGLLGHRNYAGHLCAIGLPLVLWLALTAHARLARPLLAGLSLIACALVLSRSRAAWLGATSGLAIVAFGLLFLPRDGGPRPRPERLAAVALALLLGILGAVLVPNQLAWKSLHPFQETLTSLVDSGEGSGAGRLLQYKTTLSMIAAHPLLGVGPGGWSIEYSRFAPPGDPTLKPMQIWQAPRRASSDWFGLCAERGVPGLLLLLVPMLLLARAALRELLRKGSQRGPPATADAGLDPVAERLRPVILLALLATLVPLTALDCPLQVAPDAQLAFLALGAFAAPPIGKKRALPRAFAYGTMSSVLGCCAAAYLFIQSLAGVLANQEAMPSRELGARLAPGNPRLQILAAAGWVDRQRFDLCVPWAERALSVSPTLQFALALRDECVARRAGRGPPLSPPSR